MLFGMSRSNDPPDPSRGLKPGTPLHIFKRAIHLPQSKSRPDPVAQAVRDHVPRPPRKQSVPLSPPSLALRAGLVTAGVVWLGAAVVELLSGLRILSVVGVSLAWLSIRWSRESPRHRGWWILVASALLAAARIASLVLFSAGSP